jgi:hypothetical protein
MLEFILIGGGLAVFFLFLITLLEQPTRTITAVLRGIDVFVPGNFNLPNVPEELDENPFFSVPRNIWHIMLPRIEVQDDWHVSRHPTTRIGRIFFRFIKEYHDKDGHEHVTIFGYEYGRSETLGLLGFMVLGTAILTGVFGSENARRFLNFQSLNSHVILGIVLIPFFLSAFLESLEMVREFISKKQWSRLLATAIVTILGIVLPFRTGNILVGVPFALANSYGLTVIATDIAFSSVIGRIVGLPLFIIVMVKNASFYDDAFGIGYIINLFAGLVPVDAMTMSHLKFWAGLFIIALACEWIIYLLLKERKVSIYAGSIFAISAMIFSYCFFRTIHAEPVLAGVTAWLFSSPLTRHRLWYWFARWLTIPALAIFALMTAVSIQSITHVPHEQLGMIEAGYESISRGKIAAWSYVLFALMILGDKQITLRTIVNAGITASLGYKFMSFNAIALAQVLGPQVVQAMIILSNLSFFLTLIVMSVFNLPSQIWGYAHFYAKEKRGYQLPTLNFAHWVHSLNWQGKIIVGIIGMLFISFVILPGNFFTADLSDLKPDTIQYEPFHGFAGHDEDETSHNEVHHAPTEETTITMTPTPSPSYTPTMTETPTPLPTNTLEPEATEELTPDA